MEVQVPYSSHKEFETIAKKLKIMFDLRVSLFHVGHFFISLSHTHTGWSSPDCLQGCCYCHVQRPKATLDSSTALDRL